MSRPSHAGAEAWRSVPTEPTEAMIEAAQRATPTTYLYDGEPRNIYAAMIAAAPAPDVGMREAIAKTIDTVLDGIDRDEGEPGGWWPTSTGVAFGTKVKAELIEALSALIAKGQSDG